MRNYYYVNTPPPAGIDKKSATVGGGIAGWAPRPSCVHTPRENSL